MNGILIFPESKEEINILSVTQCKNCVWYAEDWQYCRWWKHRTEVEGWCHKGEQEDTNDLYTEED